LTLTLTTFYLPVEMAFKASSFPKLYAKTISWNLSSTKTVHCSADHNSNRPCCGQPDSKEDYAGHVRQCPALQPICSGYVANQHLGTCGSPSASTKAESSAPLQVIDGHRLKKIWNKLRGNNDDPPAQVIPPIPPLGQAFDPCLALDDPSYLEKIKNHLMEVIGGHRPQTALENFIMDMCVGIGIVIGNVNPAGDDCIRAALEKWCNMNEREKENEMNPNRKGKKFNQYMCQEEEADPELNLLQANKSGGIVQKIVDCMYVKSPVGVQITYQMFQELTLHYSMKLGELQISDLPAVPTTDGLRLGEVVRVTEIAFRVYTALTKGAEILEAAIAAVSAVVEAFLVGLAILSPIK